MQAEKLLLAAKAAADTSGRTESEKAIVLKHLAELYCAQYRFSEAESFARSSVAMLERTMARNIPR